MQVIVTFLLEVDEQETDPDHRMGITSEAFDRIYHDVSSIGGENVDVEPAD